MEIVVCTHIKQKILHETHHGDVWTKFSQINVCNALLEPRKRFVSYVYMSGSNLISAFIKREKWFLYNFLQLATGRPVCLHPKNVLQ